jgi:integrase
MRHAWEDHQVDSTYLHRDQLAEAAKAYKLIASLTEATGKASYTLLGIVQDFAGRERQACKSVTLEALIDEYVAARAAGASSVYLTTIKGLKARLPGLGHRMVSSLTPGDLETWLRGLTASMRNATLRYLKAILNYGVKRGYLAENPVARIDFAAERRGEVQIWQADEVQRLLEDCLARDLELLPYRLFTIYCGIRPHGEMSRLRWSDVNLAKRVVKLQASITKKGRTRYPLLDEAALAWLEAYRLRGGSMEGAVAPWKPTTLKIKCTANFRRAKVRNIKNGGRHSYCSYHLAHFNDINALTLQSGHSSTDVMFKHYYRPALKDEAARFWNVMPQASEPAVKVVAFVQ